LNKPDDDDSKANTHNYFGLSHPAYYGILFVIGSVAGWFVCRLLLLAFALYQQVGRVTCGSRCCYYMKAIFTFWDVEFFEELTLNFHIDDYNKYGSPGVMSGLKDDDDLDDESLKKALKAVRDMEDSEHF